MNVGLERCVTFAFVFVTFAVTLCQGQNTCHIHSRPHPSGVCGAKLARAHQNLCFVLRNEYPGHFTQKRRSERSSSRATLEAIYSLPLSVLAELDLTKDDWKSYINNKRSIFSSMESDIMPRDRTELDGLMKDNLAELSKRKANPTAELIRILGKRSLGVVQKRNTGMVCDCCINMCTAQELATYC